ncbi:MAG: hypothetical protein FWB91_00070 [Defluviitaleaceae bacterium]|nr:hypothetical protein [Defluviitaleaceae bacterium]
MASEGINFLARTMEKRMKECADHPPVLDFGEIQEDMSLLTNYFPVPIPYGEYSICRSVSYDPEIPLSMTWWQDEGWNKQTATPTDWQTGDPDGPNPHTKQPQQWTANDQPVEWKGRWGELINPGTGNPYWDEKHKTPPIVGADHIHDSKGEHDHGEDPDGKHYHDVYLPRKMYRIQPGDRVLVAWVGTKDEDHEAVIIDIVMKSTVKM